MAFTTKLDFSNNRQVKQRIETISVLSGATSFGVTFSSLPTGADTTTSAITSSVNGAVSTFSGNSSVTNYTWYDPRMSLADGLFSAITPTNSGITQNSGQLYSAATSTTIDGNVVNLTYTGVSFDITPISLVSLGGGAYSGTVDSSLLLFLSAGTLDFTGRTIWVDVSGLTRTENLIVTNIGSSAFINDVRIDATGKLTTNTSDIRLKENITPLGGSLNKIKQLNPVTYQWKDKIAGGDEIKMGFIAQEVENVEPLLVFTNKVDGFKGIHIDGMIPMLVEAVKELSSGTTTSNNVYLETQSIFAEDNNIDLNYSGTQETSVGGGIRVLHAMGQGNSAELLTDNNGNWYTNNEFKPNSLVIPVYTPLSSSDFNGNEGNITRDDNFLYVKTANGWKRSSLESF
jgi:hypothetical protein